MKISYNWLKEYVPLDVTAEELARHLLKLGFEVSETVPLGAGFTGVVIGEVLKVEKHPNADRLKLCEVSDGQETFSVVCGAPNVAEGQHIPFARIGARLPGDFKIKKSKIRGSVSHGMICSSKELNLPENGAAVNGILVLPADTEIGSDFGKMLGEPDVVLEVDITPNRPDCLSHLGLARELAVYFNKKTTPPERPEAGTAHDGPASFPIETADENECPRYRGQLIDGVKIGPSPKWLVDRLTAVGLRPINNAVDITNFVLQETGQPLHVFDADKLEGEKILVRNAAANEKIKALDGKEYALTPRDLIIADAARPVAIAGVIGGEESSVTESTKRVFLECANFRPGRIRLGAKRLGLRTDSSYRFERGVDLGGVAGAAERACALILELCGGNAGAPLDTRPAPPAPKGIEITASRINEILGADYPEDRITAVLKALSEHTGDDGKILTVYPPSYRLDLETPHDLAEEIGRHLGYSVVPSETAPVRLPQPEPIPMRGLIESLRPALAGLGFYEAYNYDFLSEKEVLEFRADADLSKRPKLLNPISQDWAYLREDLLPGLLRNTAMNINHGAQCLRLFEIGRVYSIPDGDVSERTHLAGILAGPAQAAGLWTTEPREPDFYEAKGVVESILSGRGVRTQAAESGDGIFHPNACLDILHGKDRIGCFGLLHPDLLRRWDIKGTVAAAFEFELDGLVGPAGEKPAKLKSFSVFPSSARDISILVAEDLPYLKVEKTLRGKKIAELARTELLDLFTGKGVPAGKKSLTIRLTFSHRERTLKDE
ncbi:MAG: phenylalanine--tRNA ligase subunit beta, partial [Elusimicrobiota bacterium]